MKASDKKKIIVLSMIVVLLIMFTAFGFSYAYFMASIGTGATSNIVVKSGDVDTLSFVNGLGYNNYRTGTFTADSTFYSNSHVVSGTLNDGNLGMTINQDNFSSGTGDVCSYITPYVYLNAKSNSETTYSYNVMLALGGAQKPIIYTNGSIPEVVLNVVKEVYFMSPESPFYSTFQDGTALPASITWIYQNLDITGKYGLGYYIPTTENASDLTTTSATHTISGTLGTNVTHVFRIEICFKNLDSNQAANAGKQIEGNVIFSSI